MTTAFLKMCIKMYIVYWGFYYFFNPLCSLKSESLWEYSMSYKPLLQRKWTFLLLYLVQVSFRICIVHAVPRLLLRPDVFAHLWCDCVSVEVVWLSVHSSMHFTANVVASEMFRYAVSQANYSKCCLRVSPWKTQKWCALHDRIWFSFNLGCNNGPVK